jgi:hypothetical protein
MQNIWGRDVDTGFWWGDLREGDHFGNQGIDGSIISKWTFNSGIGRMNWIVLAQDRGGCGLL